MSVILFDQCKVDKILGMVKYHHNEVTRLLGYSPHFSHYSQWLKMANDKLTREQAANEFIGRMLWYTFVANKIAYALQYQVDVTFKDINIDYEEAQEIPCSKENLFLELRHLNYNIHTNDGNMFMEEKWHDPLNDICNALACGRIYELRE